MKLANAKKIYWNFSQAELVMFNPPQKQLDHELKINREGYVRYIFASLFCMSKIEHLQNKEKCFLFHFESSFHS